MKHPLLILLTLTLASLACSDLSEDVAQEHPPNIEPALKQEGEVPCKTCDPAEDQVSTFSIDVDRASYAYARSQINRGVQPREENIRVEEFINYFPYNFPEPTGEHPFGVFVDSADSPWSPEKKMVRIGLQGKNAAIHELPASNLVFLVDVSGSMGSELKLPLLKAAMKTLVTKLGERDRVAIVTYANGAGVLLDSTSGEDQNAILRALDSMVAQGGTNGGSGIQMAYDLAASHLIQGGNNRVILATDGDFNVGILNQEELLQMIRQKAEGGIALTALGFGQIYNDQFLEYLADHGDGNYAMIDSLEEANKVFGSELQGTLYTIAKDVKIQVEFNQDHVASYRLIGYENRALDDDDFQNDAKDSGDMGVGHTVTALYEVGLKEGLVDPNPHLATLKIRYKLPQGSEGSTLMEKDIVHEASELTSDFGFALSAAAFGLVLQGDQTVLDWGLSNLTEFASRHVGEDPGGERTEMLELLNKFGHTKEGDKEGIQDWQ